MDEVHLGMPNPMLQYIVSEHALRGSTIRTYENDQFCKTELTYFGIIPQNYCTVEIVSEISSKYIVCMDDMTSLL